MIRKSATAACFLAATLVGSAGATEPGDNVADAVNLEFKAMPIITSQAPQPEAPEDDITPSISAAAPFGQAGSWRWNVQGGFGAEFDDTNKKFGLGGLSFSYFAADDFSVDIEFNGLYFDQDTAENAGGFNFNLLLRWHVLARDDWSWTRFQTPCRIAVFARYTPRSSDSASPIVSSATASAGPSGV